MYPPTETATATRFTKGVPADSDSNGDTDSDSDTDSKIAVRREKNTKVAHGGGKHIAVSRPSAA